MTFLFILLALLVLAAAAPFLGTDSRGLADHDWEVQHRFDEPEPWRSYELEAGRRRHPLAYHASAARTFVRLF